MASKALDTGNIVRLAQYAEKYWEDEASVNGIWVSLLSEAFPSSLGFVLQPEGQGDGGKKRNDILVRQITNFETGDVTAYLAFEGKSSKSNHSLDDAANQLRGFVEDSRKQHLSGNERIWGVAAKGTSFRLMFYGNGSEFPLNLQTRGNTGRPWCDDMTAHYSLNDPTAVEKVKAFLEYARDNIGDWRR